jgi:RNA-dependent RNA polymerase
VPRLIYTDVLTSCFPADAPHNEGEKVPTEKILTDGCGFINGAALTLIARRLNLPSRPTAVQGRVAGSKGLWILHREDRSHKEPPRIWIRSSQQKVKLPRLEEGSAHVVFDVITQSNHIKVPARLNYQTVINLAENGVDAGVFEGLMRDGLTQSFSSFTQWDGPGAMPLLWREVNNLGGVTKTRLQMIACGLERAIGLSSRFEMDRKGDEDESNSNDESSSPESDRERSLYGAVLELIQAGFDPKCSPILNEKMRRVVSQAMDRHLDKFHLDVRQSAEAFIVPGASGVSYSLHLNLHFQNLSRPFQRPGRRGNPFQVVPRARRPVDRNERILRSGSYSREFTRLWSIAMTNFHTRSVEIQQWLPRISKR